MCLNLYVKLFLLICATIFLTSCNSDRSIRDLRNYIDVLKKDETDKQNKVKMVEIPPPVTAVYRAGNLRAPVEGATPAATPTNNTNNPITPLQHYPLSVLRFVGTVAKDGDSVAYIQTPDNMVYAVKKGDAIGNHQGRVMSIESTRVNIMEQDEEPGKPPLGRVVTLQLKDNK